jgi:hypothetical protein
VLESRCASGFAAISCGCAISGGDIDRHGPLLQGRMRPAQPGEGAIVGERGEGNPEDGGKIARMKTGSW